MSQEDDPMSHLRRSLEVANHAVEHECAATREHTAMHLYVRAAGALMEAARLLAAEPLHRMPPDKRTHRLKLLVEDTKLASRAAYRAALTLAGQAWQED
jgi:hypothetical protein